MSNRTWLVVVLISSVALNLLFLGVVIGRNLGAGPKHHFEWIMQEVDEETRKKLHSSMHAHREATRPTIQALRKAQRQLHETIAADPYIEEDARRALEQVRRYSAVLQDTMHRQMLGTLSNLEQEERMKVFRALSSRDLQIPHKPRGRPRPIESRD